MWIWIVLAFFVGIIVGIRDKHLAFQKIADNVKTNGKSILTFSNGEKYEVKKYEEDK